MNKRNLVAAAIMAAVASCPAVFTAQQVFVQQSERILPLSDIIERGLKAFPGQLLEAETDGEDGQAVYELEIVDRNGRRRDLYYDQVTGELIKVKETRNQVYDMHRAGDVLPLPTIFELAQQVHPGELLEAELDEELWQREIYSYDPDTGELLEAELQGTRGVYVYELEIAGHDGVHRELYMDARTGELLKIEHGD